MRGHSPTRITPTLFLAAALIAGGAFGQGVIPVGDLPPGESVSITFNAVIDNPVPFGTTFVVNQGTVNGTNIASIPTDDPDDITSDTDPTETPLDLLALGNVVWQDNGDGIYDGGILDVPVGGVLVNLFTDDGGTPGVLDAGDTFRASTSTVVGVYGFGMLTPGDYIVQIDASNFTAGMPLENFFSVGGAPDPDNDVDNDDNGIDALDFAGGISSAAITLVTDTEPDTIDDGDDTDGNQTLDFGFTEGPDLSMDKSDDGTDAVAGTDYTYTLEITNNGPVDSVGSTVTDTLPAGWTFSSSSNGTCVGDGMDPETVTCDVGALTASTSTSFTITASVPADAVAGTVTNSATVTGDDPDPDSGNDTDTEMTDVVRDADLSMDKSDDGSDAVAGTDYTYTLEVTNNGTSDSAGSTVTDTLPAGWTFSSSSNGTCVGDGMDPETVTCDVGALTVSAMSSFTITASVPSSAVAGTVTNTADVTGDDPDSDSGNDSDSEMTDVVRDADLAIDKTDSGADAVAGEDYTYTLQITNNGPSDSAGATVTDTLPAGWTFSSSSNGTCAGDGMDPETVTCTIGALVDGAMTSFTITASIPSDAAEGTVTNSADVTGDDPDGNAGNDSDTEPTDVITEADLEITKVDSVDPVMPGMTLVYTITVTNNGPSDAQNVVGTDTLPAVGVSFLATSGCANDPNGVPTCDLGTMAAGAMASYTVSVSIDSPAPAGLDLITNQASVASDTTDPNGANDSTDETTAIDAAPDLTILKDDGGVTSFPGGVITYTLDFANDGNQDATGVEITDTVPAETTFNEAASGGAAVWSCADGAPAGTVCTHSIGALGGGGASGSVTFGVTVLTTVPLGVVTEIDNTASIADDGANGADPNPGDNTDDDQTPLPVDFGDAADPVDATPGEYPTLLASDGARHGVVPGFFLGAAIDDEFDGQPTLAADGDDTAGIDDEDGVTFAAGVSPGTTTEFEVVASAAGLLNVWVDFAVDGSWADAGDHALVDVALLAGVNMLSFDTPATALDSDLADLLGGTFVRFRFASSGGLSFDGQASDGEVEDYFVSIITDADLAVTLDQQVDPLVAGDIQLYSLSVTNLGPSPATDVTVQQELPRGGIFLGSEPTAFDCSVLSGVLVDCDLGNLAVSDTVELTIGVLMDHRIDGSVSSEAVVAANEPDPDGSNDQADVDTDVAPAREMLATHRGSQNALAIGAKEGDNSVGLVITKLGGGDREYSVEAIGYRATSMAEVPDFDATSSPEIAVLAAGFGGETKVVVIDANDQTLLGDYDIAGDWFAMDIVSIDSFDDTTAGELALLLRDPLDTEVRVRVIDAASGAVVRDHVVATSTPDPPNEDIAAPFPIGMVSVDDFDDTPSAELAILMKNPDTEEVNVLVIDADSGAELGNHSQGTDLFALGIVSVGDLGLGGGTTAADVAALLRRASDGDLFALVLDASNGATFGPIDFDDTILPGPFDSIPDFGGSTAPELAVTGREDPDSLTISIKDSATGVIVNTIAISSPPLVPVPLDLEDVPDSQDGPAPELAVLFEYFDDPAQVQVFDGAGAAPLFTFFLP